MKYINLRRNRCPKCSEPLMRRPMYQNWKCNNKECDFIITEREKQVRMVGDEDEDGRKLEPLFK